MTKLVMCLLLLVLCLPVGVYAACGEELEEVRQELVAEGQGVRTTEQMVRTARGEFLSRDAALRAAMTSPPAGYEQALDCSLVEFRRNGMDRYGPHVYR